MKILLKTIKFGDIFYQIDKKYLNLVKNHKIYACLLNNNKLYLIRDDKIWLHQLILGKAPKGLVIDHINGDTLDNRKSNLRFITHGENRQNTTKRKLTEEEVLDILLSNQSNNILASKYNISNCLVSDIRRGKIYKQYFPDILREYLGCNYKSKRTYILT